MSADRAARQEAIVRLLAAEPGLKRSELAERFCLSERQIQADLVELRRHDYAGSATLTIVRNRGYRFALKAVECSGKQVEL